MRIKGLEPSLLSELEPKSSASANSAISASVLYNTIINYFWKGKMWDKGKINFLCPILLYERLRQRLLYVRAACRRQTLRVACFPVGVRSVQVSNYMTATRGRRCLNPQRISQEIVFNSSAQSSAEICSFPCSPSKVTTSPSWILGMALTSSIN